jgi:hypothetical protein
MSSAILGRFYEDAWVINMNGAIDMRLSKAKDMLGSMGNSAANAEEGATDG